MKTSICSRGARWFLTGALTLTLGLAFASARAEYAPPLRALFLGDNGHHKPADRFKQLQPAMASRGIEVEYTDSLADLNPAKLAGYDCLLIYANHTAIAPAQEKALLDYVAAGGGFVPLHCASYCFLNSPAYIDLVGGQFLSHGTGVFHDTIVRPDHPIMKGLSPIESWDETYVHTKLNPKNVVLAERVEGDHHEPYTWAREQGKGRIFYTAWGHDQRTWSNPGFLALVENGIRWAAANSPNRLQAHTGLKPFEFTESPANIPNYTVGARWGAQSEPIRTMQKPLEPAESMKHLVTFPEFDVKLFASEPQIYKPIWMAWDERGRLWIAETIDYPNNMQPPGEGHDRISICEDTDGDGIADKFTVFADKLSVPTSFVFANGGIIVVHSGKTEFFKDTDGDGKADVRQVLFTGWGTNDTHAGPSNLHYGFDNWIWGTVGYSGFRGEVGGKRIQFGQGIYRFKPDGSKLEFIRASNNNTWGLGFNEDGIVFGSTANGNASMYMPIPNRYYEAVNGWSAGPLQTIADSQRYFPITDKVRQVDYFGRYTAGAGSGIYTARNFPKEYWDAVQFVAEPTGHLLGKFHLEARGADFIAHNGRNFTASDDEWTAPICAEVGPDGALWMIDWYNYIIQHNPTPQGFRTGRGNAYDTPLRDKTHGRIYRLVYKNAKPAPKLNLAKASPRQLVAALGNDNLLWRMTAQRLLVQRGQKDVVPALCDLVRSPHLDELGLAPAALHALWTLDGLGALSGNDSPGTRAALSALGSRVASVRRTAVTVLPRTPENLAAILRQKLLDDPDPQVRLAGLLALSEMPATDVAGEAVYAMLQQPRNADDRWLPDAATAAAARNDFSFLKAAMASFKPATPGGQPEAQANLIANPSFENEKDGKPIGWRASRFGGRQVEQSLAAIGHTGSRSVKVASEQGADAGWSITVAVKPRTDYRLSGWIKTENLRRVAGGRGALLNIHELQDPDHGATKGIAGDNDWTRVEVTFNSSDMTEVTINCLFGGWGQARGAAWFDDIELTQVGDSALAGEVGRVVRLVTASYAQRGPVDTIVAMLLALKTAAPSLAVPILDGLVWGWPEGKSPTLNDADKHTLTGLMDALPESERDRLLALAQKWGNTELFGANVAAIVATLEKQVTDDAIAESQRVAAAKRWLGLDDKPAVVETVLKQVNLLTPPGLATGLMGALSESRDPKTGAAVVAHWPELGLAARRAAIGALLRRTEWALALLDSIQKNKIQKTDLAPEYWSQLKSNPNRAVSGIATRLAESGNAISADREAVVKKLLPLAKENGDINRGKEVFTTTCSTCHTFNGAGGKIGPDLTGVGARERSEILIDILDPNRSVEANFRLWNVTTKGGETFSGRMETETQTTVEILDTAGQKHVIQRKDIATLEGTLLSIMPNGFESLPPDDLKALLTYLTQTRPQ